MNISNSAGVIEKHRHDSGVCVTGSCLLALLMLQVFEWVTEECETQRDLLARALIPKHCGACTPMHWLRLWQRLWGLTWVVL